MSKETPQPSWLTEKIEAFAEAVSNHMFNMSLSPELTKNLIMSAESEFKKQITTELLNLIEQSKDKNLPLHWLEGEIKKL